MHHAKDPGCRAGQPLSTQRDSQPVTRSAKRYRRTIFLGVLALGTLVWSAVDQFGIPMEEMIDLFLTTVMGVLSVIAVAAVVAVLWFSLRWLLRDRS